METEAHKTKHTDEQLDALTKRIREIKVQTPGIFAKDIYEALHSEAEGGKWSFASLGRVKKVNARINKANDGAPTAPEGDNTDLCVYSLARWPAGKLKEYMHGKETAMVSPGENIRSLQAKCGVDVGDLSDLDFRRSFQCLGEQVDDNNVRMFTVEDEGQTQGFCIYVHAVLVDPATTRPLFLCDYMFNTRAALEADPAPLQDMKRVMEYNASQHRGSAQIKADLQEQRRWREALQAGEARAKAAKPSRSDQHEMPPFPGFTRTCFPCPAGRGHDGVRPAYVKVCGHCDSPTARKSCTACKSVMYCNRECQKAHWKKHKKVCGRRPDAPPGEEGDGGESVVVAVDHCPEELRGLYQYDMSYQGYGSRPSTPGTTVPKNIHGDNQFMVKVQLPLPGLDGLGGGMMIYDEARSFKRMMGPDEDEAYRKIRSLVSRVGVMGGVKGFLWCRREGTSLRFYLDPAGLPSQQQTW